MALLFTARVVCQRTVLAWTRGEEMAELATPQLSPDWVGILCLVVGVGWAIAAIVCSLLRRSHVATVDRWLIGLIVMCCGLWWMPYEQWNTKFLVAHGAQLENRTLVSLQTPLTEAAQQNHAANVELPLAHGANVNAKDAMGMTAIDWAQECRTNRGNSGSG